MLAGCPGPGEQHQASGKKIISAYVLGWEIQGRLRAASAPATAPGYHPPGLVGPLGAAAAAAKTLGLDGQQTLMALGIAASRTGGLTANTGTMVKSTHPGNAARMGAEAAILANMGYTASAEALESPVGYAARPVRGQFQLGRRHRRTGSCLAVDGPRLRHQAIPCPGLHAECHRGGADAAEGAWAVPESIEQVTIHRQGRGHSGPLPRSGLDGKFSVEYCAAAALLDGQVGIDPFTDARRFAGDMEDMLGRIRVEPEGPESGATLVTALLKNGATVRSECSAFRGSAKTQCPARNDW